MKVNTAPIISQFLIHNLLDICWILQFFGWVFEENNIHIWPIYVSKTATFSLCGTYIGALIWHGMYLRDLCISVGHKTWSSKVILRKTTVRQTLAAYLLEKCSMAPSISGKGSRSQDVVSYSYTNFVPYIVSLCSACCTHFTRYTHEW